MNTMDNVVNRLQSSLHDRRVQGLVYLLSVLLLLAVIYSGVQTAWVRTNHAQPVALTPVVIHSDQDLSNLHLLGRLSMDLSALPNTSLPIKLQGTMVAVNAPSYSSVLIRLSNGHTKRFYRKDTIMGQAIIRQITRNEVVLNHNGVLEALRLPIKTLSSIKLPPQQ